MTSTETVAATELTRLGEAYFATQHSYDPYNTTLLGVDEFDGLSFDPSREASERTADDLAAIGRQVRDIDTAGLSDAQRVDHGVLTALVEGARSDAEHSLWAANASAKSYVSRQGLIFQAVPAMTIAGTEGAERYLSRLSKIGATLDTLGARYLAEAAGGRIPTAVGVDHSIRQLEGYLALPVADDALLKPASPGCGRRSDGKHSARATSPRSPRGCARTRRCASAPVRRSSPSRRMPWTGPRRHAAPTSSATTFPPAPSRRSTRSTRTTPRSRTTGRHPSTAAVPARTAC